ncbi:hypothetical protein [Xanthomonas arboricola]|uniref:hypothetical protein n=1 Tax=Xanthomonas arboricola TaxID=56448 RepID=UPI0011B00969|nr:hypothetical protein [Xanthomonas arboricola]
MKIFVYSLVAISVLCTSDYSLACSIPASAPPQRDTEDDQVRRADLVVIGKVIEIQKVPDLEPKGYASRLKISVERWVKGGGPKILEVVDTTGTGCDSVFDINHIVMHPYPLSPKWKLYLSNWKGKIYVGNAKEI